MDRIDLQLLNLLRQRTKIAEKIGRTKLRHGLDIYVPGRERELLARIHRRSRGRIDPSAVAAIYREILSSSRAAQGQPPIGVLADAAEITLAAARSSFGACDRFVAKKSWSELARALKARRLALAVVTGEDLLDLIEAPRARHAFAGAFTVAGEIGPLPAREPLAGAPLFILTLRSSDPLPKANRLLILIECKPAVNAVKTLLKPMAARFTKAELCARSTGGDASHSLVRLETSAPFDPSLMARSFQAAAAAAALHVTILGAYPGPENYGG